MKARYWHRNKKKDRYSTFHSPTGQAQILKSGYTELQTRYALSKAWIGYKIAKRKGEHDKLKYYASGIQKLQKELIDAGIATIRPKCCLKDTKILFCLLLGLLTK
jgi:hypothetical protein